MVNVTKLNDLLDGNVGLDIDRLDRFYLNAYGCGSAGGMVQVLFGIAPPA